MVRSRECQEGAVAQVRVRPLYPINEFCQDFGIARAAADREIKAGRLYAFKVYRRLMVAGEDALEWRDLYRSSELQRRVAA
jgi:hypothetical protein